jgi:HK97 family phage major capsid protein
VIEIDIKGLRGLDAHVAAEEQLVARMQELDADADGAAMTEAQREEFEAIAGDDGMLAQVRATIEELKIRDSRIRQAIAKGAAESAASTVFSPFSVKKVPDNIFDLAGYRKLVGSVDDLPQAYRDGAMRVLEQASFPATADEAKAKASVEKLLAPTRYRNAGAVARRIIGTGSPEYQEAISAYLAGGLHAVPQRLQAALQTYTDADGGFQLPFTIDPTIVLTSDGALNELRGIARIETITTKSWQAITSAGVTAAYAAETAAASDGAPSDLDDPGITPVRAHVFVPFTAEYAEDFGPAAVLSEVGTLVRDAKDVLEADKFELGVGVTEPDGIIHAVVTAATSIVLTAVLATTDLDDIDGLIAALPPRFRARARFLAQLATYMTAAGFGTAGQPADSIYSTTNKNLRGFPGNESTSMDTGASTTGKNILLFGDFKQFVIVDRVGLSVEYIPQVFNGNGEPLGQRGVYARWRNGSGMLTAAAFRLLQVK